MIGDAGPRIPDLFYSVPLPFSQQVVEDDTAKTDMPLCDGHVQGEMLCYNAEHLETWRIGRPV